MANLLEARFPKECRWFQSLVEVMVQIAAASARWNGYGRLKKKISLSWRHGKSNAAKYQEEFSELFAMLDKSQKELINAVVVQSFDKITIIQEQFDVRCHEQQMSLLNITQSQVGQWEASLHYIIC